MLVLPLDRENQPHSVMVRLPGSDRICVAERPVGTLPVAHEQKPCERYTPQFVAAHDVDSSKINDEEHAVAEYIGGYNRICLKTSLDWTWG